MFTTLSNWASLAWKACILKLHNSFQKGLILQNCMFSQTFYPNLQKFFTRIYSAFPWHLATLEIKISECLFWLGRGTLLLLVDWNVLFLVLLQNHVSWKCPITLVMYVHLWLGSVQAISQEGGGNVDTPIILPLRCRRRTPLKETLRAGKSSHPGI